MSSQSSYALDCQNCFILHFSVQEFCVSYLSRISYLPTSLAPAKFIMCNAKKAFTILKQQFKKANVKLFSRDL